MGKMNGSMGKLLNGLMRIYIGKKCPSIQPGKQLPICSRKFELETAYGGEVFPGTECSSKKIY